MEKSLYRLLKWFFCFIKISPSLTFFFCLNIKKGDHTANLCRLHCKWSMKHTTLQFEMVFFDHYFNLLHHITGVSFTQNPMQEIWSEVAFKEFLHISTCTKEINILRLSQKLILIYTEENILQPSFHNHVYLRNKANMGIFGTYKIMWLLADCRKLSAFQTGVQIELRK